MLFVLMLHSCASQTALKYVSDVCGNLKGVALLRNLVTHKSSVILELIGKWKHLEFLILGSTHRLEEILSRISIHCKDLCALHLGNANICKDEAMAIVSFLPKIKSLF
ncbi:PREDICTED: F-box/LRR-repeat [Prunus dulcis]|uniref:PREDICTED: F-box/LRR-repeat n=1 Tax=Prunus dulcis TaxID=3755 RepID=A0A5E4FC32_PRUDU|nr:hypothetical protein L3X38_002694 [Prunus dulcis]VVA25476.1 PREDICTED: F-box/LRR-repeat [Prunus dulcis]